MNVTKIQILEKENLSTTRERSFIKCRSLWIILDTAENPLSKCKIIALLSSPQWPYFMIVSLYNSLSAQYALDHLPFSCSLPPIHISRPRVCLRVCIVRSVNQFPYYFSQFFDHFLFQKIFPMLPHKPVWRLIVLRLMYARPNWSGLLSHYFVWAFPVKQWYIVHWWVESVINLIYSSLRKIIEK